MNVVVLLNMAMAAVMAILVALRVLEALCLIVLTIATALMFVPYAQAVAAPIARAAGQMQLRLLNMDRKWVSPQVAKGCSAINFAEKVTSTVVPPLATIIASADTMIQYDTFAVGFSSSMFVPPQLVHMGFNAEGRSTDDTPKSKKQLWAQWYGLAKDKDHDARGVGLYLVEEYQKCIQKKPPGRKPGKVWEKRYADAAQLRMGAPFSLPIMEDRIGRLCREASIYQDFVFGFLLRWDFSLNPNPAEAARDSFSGSLDFVQHSWFSEVKANLLASAPSLFCLPPTEGMTDIANMAQKHMESQAQMACENQEGEFRKKSDDDKKADPLYNPKDGKFDRKKCKQDAYDRHKDEVKKIENQQKEAREALDNVAACIKPAKVWEVARNNNLYMVSWGWNLKGLPDVDTDCKPYTPPPKDAARPWEYPDPDCDTRVENLVTAQAEMQFECKDKWINCDPNAMWRWNWSAIPRKDAKFWDMVGDAAALAFATGISHGLERYAGNLMFKKYGFTDLKYGSTGNPLRDAIQQAVYEKTPGSRTQNGNTNFH